MRILADVLAAVIAKVIGMAKDKKCADWLVVN
jgi:hypothetical protein